MKRQNKVGLIVKLAVLAVIVIYALIISANPNKSSFAGLVSESLGYISATGSFAITMPRIVAAVIALAVCMLVSTLIKLVLTKLEGRSKRMLTVSSILKSLVQWITAIWAAVWILSVFGIDMSVALAGVGIVALVLSFGAQSLVEDVVTGIFIMFEGAIDVGDIVVLDDFRGTVKSIGVRTTVIEDAGLNHKIVNNSDIRSIQNRSRSMSVAICDISASYSSNIPFVEEVLDKAAEELWIERIDIFATKPRYAGVQALADSSVVFRMLADVKESDIFAAQRLMNRKFKMAFDENGVEIPFPQVVVHKGE